MTYFLKLTPKLMTLNHLRFFFFFLPIIIKYANKTGRIRKPLCKVSNHIVKCILLVEYTGEEKDKS